MSKNVSTKQLLSSISVCIIILYKHFFFFTSQIVTNGYNSFYSICIYNEKINFRYLYVNKKKVNLDN